MGKPTKIFIVLLGIMLLFTVISRSAASFTVAQVRVEQPQARKIEHKVTGDGTVEKLLDQAVYAPADILVAKVNVRKGQNVKKGQMLAVLDMDSLKDKIQTISDDIEILQLQNDALLSAEAKKNSDRNQAVARAKEDYRDTVRNNADAVRDAKKDVKDTKTRLRREQAQAYEKKLEELQTAVKEAKKTYDDAIEQQKTEEQQARRAVEDAAKTPVSDYSDTITQIEINQKQRKLDATQKKTGCPHKAKRRDTKIHGSSECAESTIRKSVCAGERRSTEAEFKNRDCITGKPDFYADSTAGFLCWSVGKSV